MNYENGQKICPICHKKSIKQIDTIFLGKVLSFSQLQKYAVMDIGGGIVSFKILSLSFPEKPHLVHTYTRTHNQVGLEFLLHSQVSLKFKMAKY